MGRFINADGYATTGVGLLGNNMFAYCNNNTVNCTDPSGYLLGFDDNVLCGVGVLLVVVVIPFLMPPPVVLQETKTFEYLTSIAEKISTLLLSKKKPQSLPTKGEPNSDKELLNEDGTVKQRRHYDENGDADYDVDFNHQNDGTHEFPHVHKWNNGTRPHKSIPFSEFFTLN